MYSNVTTSIDKCELREPLTEVGGTPSDHDSLLFSMNLPNQHDFEWVEYRAREMTQKNLRKFEEAYTKIDWTEEIGHIECSTMMVNILHEIINRITDECIPWKTWKVRSTDDPWISDDIRRAIRRRKRCYRKNKRSSRWAALKAEKTKIIREAKEAFYQGAVNKMKEAESCQLPYRALKDLAVPDWPQPWTVNACGPEYNDNTLAERLATYFTKIMDEFVPLQNGVPSPVTYSSSFPLIEPHEIAEKIRAEKKSKSSVGGDILPSLASKYSDLTAIPATRIINYSLQLGQWPAAWRLETQSAIPKVRGRTILINGGIFPVQTLYPKYRNPMS